MQLNRGSPSLISVDSDGVVSIDSYDIYIRALEHRLSPELRTLADPDRLMPWNSATFLDSVVTGFAFSRSFGEGGADRLTVGVRLRSGREATIHYLNLLKVVVPPHMDCLLGRVHYHEMHVLPLGCIRHRITFRQRFVVELWCRDVKFEESVSSS